MLDKISERQRFGRLAQEVGENGVSSQYKVHARSYEISDFAALHNWIAARQEHLGFQALYHLDR